MFFPHVQDTLMSLVAHPIFIIVFFIQAQRKIIKTNIQILTLLKVSYFQNGFWGRRFPPKNERKQVNLRYHSSEAEFVRSFFGGNQ